MVQLWPVVLLVFSPSRVSGLKKGKYVQDWPIPVQDINDELVKCGICGGYLGLVAQVLAMYSFLLTFSISIAFALRKWDGCCKSLLCPHQTWPWFCFSSCSKPYLCTLCSLQSSHDLSALDCDHCIPCFSINRACSPLEIALTLSIFHVNVHLRHLDFSIENFPSSRRYMHLLHSMDQKSMSDPCLF